MGSTVKTVPGPRLFGVHAPTKNTETCVEWKGRGWSAVIQDRGRVWEAYYCNVVIGGAYATRNSAKTAMGLA